jgi:hypothetical protein
MKTHLLLNCHAMKTYWGSGSINPCTFNFRIKWRWVVSFTPRPLYPRCPFDSRLGGSYSRSGGAAKEKNSHHCPGRELNYGRLARRLISILTELHRLYLTKSTLIKYISLSKGQYESLKKFTYSRVYPKVSGLTSWSENCKWYNSLPLGAVVSLFYESV